MESREVCNVLTAALLKHDNAMAGFTDVNRNMANAEYVLDKLVKESLESAFVFKTGVLADAPAIVVRARSL